MSNQAFASPSSAATQEYVVRVPKNNKKQYNVMKFSAGLNIDATTWSNVKMERENNMKDYKMEDEMPKYGMGSEYGRDAREEARKKKYGMMSKSYKVEDQPWILKVGGRAGKKYRGVREGEVTKNASYYVFTQAPDGGFEAFPVEEWHNFTPIMRYKTLNAEEAEEEFSRRDKVLNYFTIMEKKRWKKSEEGGEAPEEGEEKKKGKKKEQKYGKGSGDLKISDMDEWIASSDEGESGEEKEGSGDEGKKKDKKKKKDPKKIKKKKKKGANSDDDDEEEPEDESGDGDGEGDEMDYISDSSSEEEQPEEKAKDELKGVEDEEAIRVMEESEEEEEEEKKENGEEVKEDTAKPAAKEKSKDKEVKKEDASSDSGSDTSESDDFDNDTSYNSAMFMQNPKKSKRDGSTPTTSRSNTPTKAVDKDSKTDQPDKGGVKRKTAGNAASASKQAAKKIKTERPAPPVGPSVSAMDFTGSEGITEDAVRRYLMRKPMTTTELLQKFKSKKTGMTSEQMVNTMTQILKRLNPDKQTIKGKMYLSVKPR